MESWLALAIGNTHLHWGLFIDDRLHHTWDTPHLSPAQVHHLITHHFDFSLLSFPHTPHPTPHIPIPNPPLHIASVVPTQTQLWTTYPQAHFLQLADVPLQGMYSTFGLDRALTLWAAILTIGSSVLVIDAGTALTFTAANEHHQLIGGAILPGLRLQLESLSQNTAALPSHTPHPTSHTPLPPRWSLNTSEAIASGILYTLLSGIRDFLSDWWSQYPNGQVVMTGGDSDRFYHYLITEKPDLAQRVKCDRTLIFKGMQAVRKCGFGS